MAKLSPSLCCIMVLLIHVSGEKMIPKVEAKECKDALPWVEVLCFGERVDSRCWDACQQRHGPDTTARCDFSSAGSVGNGKNIPYCNCLYPC